MTAIPADTPRRPQWLLPAIWLALTIGIGFALSRLEWRDALRHASGAHLGWVGVAIATNMLILPLWALEWRLLAGPARVAYGTMLDIVAWTAAILNSIPMLAGEASAIALLTTRAGLGAGAALSVLAMDQLLVAFAKVSVLVAAAIVAPLPPWLEGALLSLGTVLATATVALVVLAHRWRAMQSRLGTSRVGALARRAVQWGRHFDALRQPSLACSVAALALTKKLAEVGAVIAVQMALGLPPSASTALLVVAALAISTLVPIAPANLGVYEATVFGIYRLEGTPADIALGLAVVQHLCFLAASMLPGYLILTLRPLRRRLRPTR